VQPDHRQVTLPDGCQKFLAFAGRSDYRRFGLLLLVLKSSGSLVDGLLAGLELLPER